jgi:hypothetical protein
VDNNEIAEILEGLEKSPFDVQLDKVRQYPVETLESLAVKLYGERFNQQRSYKWDLLNIILHERVVKLNRNFEWTEENRDRFIRVNDKITHTFEKAYNEAVSIANELEKRLNSSDDFIQDYEIEIKIGLYMGDEFYDADNGGIGFVLSEPESRHSPIYYSFGHSNLEYSLSEKPIYLDKSKNWNAEHLGNTFDSDYIGYAIHALLDADLWSFKDIINIDNIWADVEVVHQYFVENV